MSVTVCASWSPPPETGDSAVLSSPPEFKKTSRASWSEMSIRSICSSMSMFTSMDDMLPMGSGKTRAREKVTPSVLNNPFRGELRVH